MPSQMLVEFAAASPNEIVFADFAGDFGDSVAGTEVQLSLASIGAAAARQSTKGDLGANAADEYAVEVTLEWGSAPTAGDPVLIYFGFSDNSTAATLNPGTLTGTDGAGVTAANARARLFLAGIFTADASASGTVQRGTVGWIRPPMRYVMCNVYNGSDQSFHSDDVEMYVRLLPRVIEAQ